jgi:Fe-S-cluster-containing dehydrogenase component
MYRRDDGIADFDKRICIGDKACMAACPYDAIFIDPDDHSAEKCNMCAHGLDVGLEPACVKVCPTEAIVVGNLNDPRLEGVPGRQPGPGPGAAAGEGDPARCLLRGRTPHAGPAGAKA